MKCKQCKKQIKVGEGYLDDMNHTFCSEECLELGGDFDEEDLE